MFRQRCRYIDHAMGWTVRGSNPGRGRDIPHPSRSALGAHSASCTTGTGFLQRVKRQGRGVEHPPTSSDEVKESVELYLYSPSGPSWPVLGWTHFLFLCTPSVRNFIMKLNVGQKMTWWPTFHERLQYFFFSHTISIYVWWQNPGGKKAKGIRRMPYVAHVLKKKQSVLSLTARCHGGDSPRILEHCRVIRFKLRIGGWMG